MQTPYDAQQCLLSSSEVRLGRLQGQTTGHFTGMFWYKNIFKMCTYNPGLPRTGSVKKGFP